MRHNIPRVSHYIRGNQRVNQPLQLVVFDTETNTKSVDNLQHLTLRCGHVYSAEREGRDEWRRDKHFRFSTVESFWRIIDNLTRPKHTIYCFAHNIGFDLQVLGWREALSNSGYTIEKMIIEGPPVVIKCRKDKEGIVFIDSLNIWRQSLASIGEVLGYPKGTMPEDDAPLTDWQEYCQRDCIVLMQWIQRWLLFLRDHDLGNFGYTLASQAYNSFRHRFMHHKILVHCDDNILAMERDAYYGGRVECFRLGTYRRGTYHCYDINSMYPFVMATQPFPTRLLAHGENMKLSQAAHWVAKGCLLLDCTVKVTEPYLPLRWKQKLLFPVGIFRTTICGKEAALALARGDVETIHRWAYYEHAILFHDFVMWGWEARQAAERQGNQVDRLNIKLLMNSLYGRFGMRGRRWEDLAQTGEPDMSPEIQVHQATGEVWMERVVAGVRQRLSTDEEPTESVPVLAAAITAAARLLLWQYMQQCPPGSLYYCDTDSLIVSDTARTVLDTQIDTTALGRLKREWSSPYLEIRNLKDYAFDGGEKIKGVRRNAIEVSPGVYQQEQFLGLKGSLNKPGVQATQIATVIKHLSRQYSKGVVGGFGRVRPYVLPDDLERLARL